MAKEGKIATSHGTEDVGVLGRAVLRPYGALVMLFDIVSDLFLVHSPFGGFIHG
jgi:hypothetical protein